MSKDKRETLEKELDNFILNGIRKEQSSCVRAVWCVRTYLSGPRAALLGSFLGGAEAFLLEDLCVCGVWVLCGVCVWCVCVCEGKDVGGGEVGMYVYINGYL